MLEMETTRLVYPVDLKDSCMVGRDQRVFSVQIKRRRPAGDKDYVCKTE